MDEQNKNINTNLNTPNTPLQPNTAPPPTNNVVPKPATSTNSGPVVDPFEEAEKKVGIVTQVNLAPQAMPAPLITAEETETEIPIPIQQKPSEPVATGTIVTKPVENIRPVIVPAEPKPEQEPAYIPQNIEQILKPISAPNLKQEKQPQTEKTSPLWKNILKTLGLFVGISVFIFLFLNSPSFIEKIKYSFSGQAKEPTPSPSPTKTITLKRGLTPTTDKEIYNAFFDSAIAQSIKNAPVTPTPAPTQTEPTQTTAPSNNSNSDNSGGTVTLSDNMLYVARINKKVPVVWNSPADEETMMANLQNGVVHYAGTALPGTGKGPIFISGHSSYYWWDKGKYKTVFANLDRVQEGDEIKLNYEGKLFTYKVYEKVIVMPDDVSVLQPTNEPILMLMTCTPTGTNLKRLIIKAKEI